MGVPAPRMGEGEVLGKEQDFSEMKRRSTQGCRVRPVHGKEGSTCPEG